MAAATITVSDREVAVSRPDKALFPSDGITKLDLASYYESVAGAMIPLVQGRAVTMHRFPDGIEGEGFYQKETPDYFPEWIETASLEKEDGVVEHVVLSDPATLVYLADQGCITPHVTLSRVDRPHHPDRLIFDLDPPEGSDDVGAVHFAAHSLRGILEDLDMTPFLMTTGSAGYHLVVPLDRSSPFDQTRALARGVAELAAWRDPDRLTVEQRKKDRGNRVFLDYLRNSYAQTSVAPYAVRPLPGGPAATPIDWEELGRTRPQSYSLANVRRRLGQKEDPWQGLSEDTGHSVAAGVEKLGKLKEE